MIIRTALVLAALAATATLAQGEAHAGTVVKVVAARDPTPIGGTFDNWWSWLTALTPDGQVLFVVRAVDAPQILPDGSTIVSYRALSRYKDGVIKALAVPGDPIPALDNPDTPIAECRLSDFTNEKDSNGLDNVLSVSVTGASGCRRSGLDLFLLGGGPQAPVALNLDSSPNGRFCCIAHPPINSRRQILFGASLHETARSGLFLFSGGAITKVAVDGDPTPIGGTYRFIGGTGRGAGGAISTFRFREEVDNVRKATARVRNGGCASVGVGNAIGSQRLDSRQRSRRRSQSHSLLRE
jgi:hypothetical protein